MDESSVSQPQDNAVAPTLPAPEAPQVQVPQPDLPHPVDAVGNEQKPRMAFPVVGIGASAGGLESYSEFLRAMPADSGMAFVFVQHLSPKRESMLADILSRLTAMPVIQVEDGMKVEANHVYVIAPGRTMTIHNGHLHLGDSLLRPGHDRPVDDFFRSLADEQRERSIAVIFSGMGSNGTAGARAVRAVGGMCIAQDPESSKFPSMPRSMIDSGVADLVLRPQDLPQALLKYASHPYVTDTTSAEHLARQERQQISEVLAVLRARGGHDFSGYKLPTLVRRIQRRMGLQQLESLGDYVRVLRQNMAEIANLTEDLMIHVSGFFRDSTVWDSLSRRVIHPLVAERHDEGSIRAWVTACATGEEAYTLAMLLVEASEAANKRFDIKIFATDTGEKSLVHARAGIFPGGIESEVTPGRLERFFEKDEASYRVKKELRELVVFAPQNVLQDPPFSRLDICTCRNLLIYLEPEVQQRLLTLLHFGLREGGALLLGTTETISGVDELFEPIDAKSRLYRRIGITRHGRVDFPLSKTTLTDRQYPVVPRPSVAQLTNQALLEHHTPAAVTIDRDHRIVFFHGNTSPYLAQPRGEPTRDLLQVVHDDIRGAVRTALKNALAEQKSSTVLDGTVPGKDGDPKRISVTVLPLDVKGANEFFIVAFSELPSAPRPPRGNGETRNKGSEKLSVELSRMRGELQSTIEELQTSNEELRASNEEVTSVNEELQSTNEELETSKEELQSLNEELTTVNAQLQAKMEELERASNDLSSLLSSTNIAVIFLDAQFRIRRYTPAVRDLIELIPSDIGRPLSDLARKFVDPNLLEDSRAVIDRLVTTERQITSGDGRTFMRRALPYRTLDNRIDGVVVTFVDISDQQRAMAAKIQAEDRLKRSAEASGVGDWELELPSRELYCSPRTRELFGVPPNGFIDAATGISLIHPDDRATIAATLQTAMQSSGDSLYRVEFRIVRSTGKTIWVEALGRVSFAEHSSGTTPATLRGTIHDVTERKEIEQALREAKGFAEAANQSKDEFLANVSHELRTPLSAMLLWVKLLADKGDDPIERREGLKSIEGSALSQQALIEDLLDTTRIATGKLRLELKPVEIAPVVRDTIDTVRPIAEAKNIRIETDFAGDVGIARIDPSRIQQVMWNLLTNAVKFSPIGGVITVAMLRGNGRLELCVTDTGNGIDPKFIPRVFERFGQADSTPGGGKSGLGLGLAISRQLVELHGGTISATSEGLGKGSRFTITLPLPPTAVNPTFVTLRSVEELRGQRLLLLEDDPITRRALVALLSATGAKITPVGTIADAFRAFIDGDFDLLISDIGLPDGDGNSFIREVRDYEARQHKPHIPAIALSAFAREQDQQLSLSSGFDRYIAKPVNPQTLVAAIVTLRPANN